MLVYCAIVPIADEAVELVDDNILKCPFLRVRNHALEVRSIVALSGQGAVDIFAHDGQSFLLREIVANAKLPFNALFVLHVGRKARIYYGVLHVLTSFFSSL